MYMYFKYMYDVHVINKDLFLLNQMDSFLIVCYLVYKFTCHVSEEKILTPSIPQKT